MATTGVSEKTGARGGRRTARASGPPRTNDPGGGDGGKFPEDWRSRRARDTTPARHRIGMWVGLASVAMLFTALTSAYVVRAGWGSDWRPVRAPTFVWVSTTLILASSLFVELARRAARRGEGRGARRHLFATLLLGHGFLCAQLLAWRQLASQGIYLRTNPHSSFFYVLTGLHGVHVLGGLAGLGYLLLRLRRAEPRTAEGAAVSIRQPSAVEAAALYWHFMDGLWVYLVLLLFLWG